MIVLLLAAPAALVANKDTAAAAAVAVGTGLAQVATLGTVWKQRSQEVGLLLDIPEAELAAAAVGVEVL